MSFFDNKHSYYGLQSGDMCKTSEPVYTDGGMIPAGVYFVVNHFPPYVMTKKGRSYDYFVFGSLIGNPNIAIRCDITQCKKI
jgi:hypothetical protein